MTTSQTSQNPRYGRKVTEKGGASKGVGKEEQQLDETPEAMVVVVGETVRAAPDEPAIHSATAVQNEPDESIGAVVVAGESGRAVADK